MDDDRTEPDAATLKAEEDDAAHAHSSDRAPSSTEEADADAEFSNLSEEERKDAAEHYKEMADLGAKVKGEGEIK